MTTLTYVVGADKHVVEAPGDGELTVIVAPDVFSKLVGGELDVAVAYMQGAVKITGDQSALYDLLPDIPRSICMNADELADLVERALPGEALSADDVHGVCWDTDEGPTVVLGDELGAVSGSVRHGIGAVQLLVVDPDARREGRGRRLLDEATTWAFDNGAPSVLIGAAPPWYLWPGIDLRWTSGLVLAESAGFTEVGAALNMSCSTKVRVAPPDGVTIRRVAEDHDADAVVALCRRAFAPAWRKEAARGIEHGACHAAFDESGALLGFAAHSVNRAGWFGPTGVDPDRQRSGVGGPLLAACLEDLQIAGYDRCEIAWIGPVGFYAKAAQAEISRTFRIVAKPKP